MKTVTGLALGAAILSLLGCAHVPSESSRLHLITENEAAALGCKHLDFVGSASGILINGKARNTAVILQKALKVPGATHLSYTKGLPGYAFTKANVWKCPDPGYTTTDPDTQAYAKKYFGHL
ncbi:MAG: hypothetical protein ACI4SV_05100 [Duodenibacillus sp.]